MNSFYITDSTFILYFIPPILLPVPSLFEDLLFLIGFYVGLLNSLSLDFFLKAEVVGTKRLSMISLNFSVVLALTNEICGLLEDVLADKCRPP